MSSQGPNSPSSVTDNSNIGTETWSNPGNAVSSNNSYATVSLTGSVTPGSQSHYLFATQFGFSIPSGTINGIVVEVEKKSGGSNSKDLSVYLIKNGNEGGTAFHDRHAPSVPPPGWQCPSVGCGCRPETGEEAVWNRVNRPQRMGTHRVSRWSLARTRSVRFGDPGP